MAQINAFHNLLLCLIKVKRDEFVCLLISDNLQEILCFDFLKKLHCRLICLTHDLQPGWLQR